MAFSIKDEQTDKLIRDLAQLTGENYTRAVKRAVKERLERLTRAGEKEREARHRRLKAFLAGRPKLAYRGKKSLKDIRDELWEP